MIEINKKAEDFTLQGVDSDGDEREFRLSDFMGRYVVLYFYPQDDTAGCTITDLRAKCRRLAMSEKNLGLIVIDYLQLIEGTGREDRMQQISSISRGLKIFVTCQTVSAYPKNNHCISKMPEVI